MVSPLFVFTSEYLLRSGNYLQDAASHFSLRAQQLVNVKNMTSLNAIPTDVEELILERVGLKIRMRALKQDGTSVVVCETHDLPANTHFALVDNGQLFKVFGVPRVIKRSVNSSRDVALCISFRSQQSDNYELLDSPKGKIEVVAGKLYCAGVNCNIDVLQNVVYILALQKDLGLNVDLYHVTAATTATFDQSNSVYSYTTAVDGLWSLKSGNEVGCFALCDNINSLEEQIQIVRGEIENENYGINLGTYADGSFSDNFYNATYDDGLLTVGSNTFVRQPCQLNTQLRNILRIPVREFTNKETGQEDVYEEREADYRVRLEGASVMGFNETNLIYEGSLSVGEPVYHKIMGVHRNNLSLRFGIVDAQTHHETPVLMENVSWSVTLDCR